METPLRYLPPVSSKTVRNWLPVKSRIEFKTLVITYKVLNNPIFISYIHIFVSCCLPLGLKQTVHSPHPLASTKHFCPENCHQLNIFSLSLQSNVNHRKMTVVSKPLRPVRMAPTVMPLSKSLLFHFSFGA